MSYYKDGVISIPNISGNIVITATAVASAKPNLFEKTPSVQAPVAAAVASDQVYIGGRVTSAYQVQLWSDGTGQLVTRPIPFVVGDTFSVSTDRANNVNNYVGCAYFYDANGNGIKRATTHESIGIYWFWDNQYKTGRLETGSITDIENAAFVRFTLAYTDINNIKITK